MSRIGTIALGAVLVVIGLASGWFAARQGVAGPGGPEEAPGAEAALSPQALGNLGVTFGEAELTSFVRRIHVQGTIVDAPLNTSPVAAPLGGIVTAVHVAPGQIVRAGQALVSVARAPIPRPELALTAELLRPVSENLHTSVAQLRTASAQYAIVRKEIDRISRFTESGTSEGLPVLPRKTLIDLEYDLALAEQAKLNAERELQRHGCSTDEIESIRGGASPPGNQRLWKRALQQNGLWGDVEETILNTLPGAAGERPWSIAAIGELSAAGLATPELAQAMTREPQVAAHFFEVASLLLQGHTVAKALLLARSGALEPIMELAAPGGRVEDFDVAQLHVRAGQSVAAGDTVVLLHDAREMWIRLEPVGEELGHVVRALETGARLEARPLLSGTGPRLADLAIYRLETRGGLEERGSVAILRVANEVVPGPDPGARSWRLRVGLRYLVAVPEQTIAKCFVLPADAVTLDGPEKVVFLRDGAGFRKQPVRVLFEDDEVAVIANDSSLFPRDEVVLTGAFQLGLALQSGGGAAADPHAGHDHG